MEVADLVAWGMFAGLIGWLGVVLWATYWTIDGEAREAEKRRDRR